MEEEQAPNRIRPTFSLGLFSQWQFASRGKMAAEDLSNPVWEWMFRSRMDPRHANNLFETGVDFPAKPRWAGCRMGQSKSLLADGRILWIAGEHEDFYDPDFYIYNEVIVEHVDGTLQILGYPEDVFPPTDFHSATVVDDDASIILIGCIGYQNARRPGFTPVMLLNTHDYEIKALETSGPPPGWIHKHVATLTRNGKNITVHGGEVLLGKSFVENIDEWSLSLEKLTWTRLTDRNWPRYQIHRADRTRLHLFEYSNLEFDLEYPQIGGNSAEEIKSQIGIAPRQDVYKALFKPSIEFELPHSSSDSTDEWRTTRIYIDGICVRFVDDSFYVTVTMEGELPLETQTCIVDELVEKLGIVENCNCISQPLHRF